MESPDYSAQQPPAVRFTSMEHHFPSECTREIGYGENSAINPAEKERIYEAIDNHLKTIP